MPKTVINIQYMLKNIALITPYHYFLFLMPLGGGGGLGGKQLLASKNQVFPYNHHSVHGFARMGGGKCASPQIHYGVLMCLIRKVSRPSGNLCALLEAS